MKKIDKMHAPPLDRGEIPGILPLRLGGLQMSEFLPKEVRAGLELARKHNQRKRSRLKVKAGDETFTILRYWDDGFALDSDDAPHLRGLVDVFDGGRHMSHCLIIASSEEAGERVFEFKRATPALDHAPRDYVRDEIAPVALIEKD